MPPVSLHYRTKLYNEDLPEDDPHNSRNAVLEIRNGQFMRGQIEKGVLHSGTKGLLHRIFNSFGPQRCADFIDDFQNVILEFMKSHSFSVGISDLVADKTTREQIASIIVDRTREVESLILDVQMGRFINETANTNRAEFELRVNNILNKATEQSGKITRNSSFVMAHNRFATIVNSGAKGTPINISQVNTFIFCCCFYFFSTFFIVVFTRR